MAERWWMLLKARLFMGVKVFAVLLTALCAGVSLAGCGRVDSAQPDSAHSDLVRSDSDYAELEDEKMQGKDLKKILDEAARQYLEENQKSYESREQVEFLSAGKKGGEDGSDSAAIIVSRVSIDKGAGVVRYEQQEEGEEQKDLVFYTEDGYYYFQAMEESTVWYRMPSKDVGINYEEIACLPDALYKDDANVKYKKINYRKDLEEGDKEEDNENQKIEVEGSYLYQDKNVNFTDIWWIKKAEGNLVKCESWRTFDSGQESHAVISIRMGEDCEKIQDFPESYLEITKEDLENGEFGL